MGLGKTFKSFLGKHANELSMIGDLIEGAFKVLPIESKEKARILDSVVSIKKSAQNIKRSIRDIDDAAGTVSKSDIDKAVKAAIDKVLPKLIEDAVKSAIGTDKKADGTKP